MIRLRQTSEEQNEGRIVVLRERREVIARPKMTATPEVTPGNEERAVENDEWAFEDELNIAIPAEVSNRGRYAKEASTRITEFEFIRRKLREEKAPEELEDFDRRWTAMMEINENNTPETQRRAREEFGKWFQEWVDCCRRRGIPDEMRGLERETPDYQLAAEEAYQESKRRWMEYCKSTHTT